MSTTRESVLTVVCDACRAKQEFRVPLVYDSWDDGGATARAREAGWRFHPKGDFCGPCLRAGYRGLADRR